VSCGIILCDTGSIAIAGKFARYTHISYIAMSANSFKGEFMQIIVDVLAVFGLLVLLALFWLFLLRVRRTFKVMDFLEIDRFSTLQSLFNFSIEDYNFRLMRAYEQSKLILFWKVLRYVEGDSDPALREELVPDEAVHQASGFSLLGCHSHQVTFEFRSLIADEELRVGVYRMIVKDPPLDIYEHCRNLLFAQQWLLPQDPESADSS
jgi:hypothetical protein